jgi:hypothetical protein
MRVFRAVLWVANAIVLVWGYVMFPDTQNATWFDALVPPLLLVMLLLNVVYLTYSPLGSAPRTIAIFRLWLDVKEAELKARAELARASIKQDHKVS